MRNASRTIARDPEEDYMWEAYHTSYNDVCSSTHLILDLEAFLSFLAFNISDELTDCDAGCRRLLRVDVLHWRRLLMQHVLDSISSCLYPSLTLSLPFFTTYPRLEHI